MKIQMRTTIANANITAVSGSIIELPDKEAKVLIDGGFAEIVKLKAQPQIVQNAPKKNDFSKYKKAEIEEFAKKANLPEKLTVPQIVAKLQEINFDPEAK